MIELALHYAKHGWPVFPLVAGGKEPLIHKRDGGHGCLDATTLQSQIETWWERYPNANVGIATGERSDSLIVDVDPRKCPQWLQSLRKLALPQTFTVRTWSGGFHLYFTYPRHSAITIGTNLLPGIDWRGTGGYVVAAGSIVEGVRYEIVKSIPIVEPPLNLVAAIRAAKAKRIVEHSTDGRMVIAESRRNDTLFRIGCGLRRFGVDFNSVVQALSAINEDHCAPQLPSDEIRTIATSCMRYGPELLVDRSAQ